MTSAPGEGHALLLAAGELARDIARRAGRAAPAPACRSTRGRSSDSRHRAPARPKATFSNTVMCGKSAYDWKTRPRLRRWTATRGDVLARQDDLPAVGLRRARHHPEEACSCRSPRARGGRGTRRARRRATPVDRDHGAERLCGAGEPASAGAAPLTAGDALAGEAGVNARSRAPSAPTTPGTSSPRESVSGKYMRWTMSGHRARASPDRPGAGRFLLVGAGELRLREAELALRREEHGDVLLRRARASGCLAGTETVGTMPIAPSARDRPAATGTPFCRSGAGPVRVPDRERDVAALEQRDDLVRLRVHHLDVGLELLDRLEARDRCSRPSRR